MTHKMEDAIQEIEISKIEIGDRARVRMGDIDSLALSMNIEGQLLPIVVDIGGGGKYRLIDGERRLHAARKLFWKKIKAILYEKLDPIKKKEVELTLCIQRLQLTFWEEARAVRDLVEKRKKEQSGLMQFSKVIRNKDIALELSMSEARLSECLRIARALDTNPELEAEDLSRTEALRRIRNKEYTVMDRGFLHNAYRDNLLHMSPLECMDTIMDDIVNLTIINDETVNIELLDAIVEKLTITGQIIVFTPYGNIERWTRELKNRKLNVSPQPYIWYKQGEDTYDNFIWAGKNITTPIRPMMNMLQAKPTGLTAKAKPLKLLLNIVKCCTERGNFVVAPQCEDIETVRCCVELGRNVRCAVQSKALREKLLLSVTE